MRVSGSTAALVTGRTPLRNRRLPPARYRPSRLPARPLDKDLSWISWLYWWRGGISGTPVPSCRSTRSVGNVEWVRFGIALEALSEYIILTHSTDCFGGFTAEPSSCVIQPRRLGLLDRERSTHMRKQQKDRTEEVGTVRLVKSRARRAGNCHQILSPSPLFTPPKGREDTE
jgi:hypothetical protein